MDKTNKDKLYSKRLASVGQFVFDKSVTDVFGDMIKRSVPGYEAILTMLEPLAERYVQENSNIYDLGCSLGAATIAIRRGIGVDNCKIIAIDNSPAMIERCQHNVDRNHCVTPVEVICADIADVAIENASMVVLNFTLQFVPLEKRLEMLRNIASGMKKGGILILSEKLVFNDEHHNELMIDLHHSFKKANGYSDLEISQKRSSLDNVLIPETSETHLQRLQQAGFTSCDIWFQCFNFASMIAVKN